MLARYHTLVPPLRWNPGMRTIQPVQGKTSQITNKKQKQRKKKNILISLYGIELDEKDKSMPWWRRKPALYFRVINLLVYPITSVNIARKR